MKKLIWAEIISLIIVVIAYAVLFHVKRDIQVATFFPLFILIVLFIIFDFADNLIVCIGFVAPVFTLLIFLTITIFSIGIFIICGGMVALFATYCFIGKINDRIAYELKIKKSTLIGFMMIEAALTLLGFWLAITFL